MTEVKIGTITDERLARIIIAVMEYEHAGAITYAPKEEDGKLTSLDVYTDVDDKLTWRITGCHEVRMTGKQKPDMIIEGVQAKALWNIVSNPERAQTFRLRTVKGKSILEVYQE
jgi:hypothetical protein